MTLTQPSTPVQNNSEHSTQDRTPHSPSAQLPPVDEVCRILARVLTRIQAGQPSDATPATGASS
jgi:hypothetical protein